MGDTDDGTLLMEPAITVSLAGDVRPGRGSAGSKVELGGLPVATCSAGELARLPTPATPGRLGGVAGNGCSAEWARVRDLWFLCGRLLLRFMGVFGCGDTVTDAARMMPA